MILSNLIWCIRRISVMLLLRISNGNGNLKWQPCIYIAPFISEVFTLYKVIWSNHLTYPPLKFCHLEGKSELTSKTDSTLQIITTRGEKQHSPWKLTREYRKIKWFPKESLAKGKNPANKQNSLRLFKSHQCPGLWTPTPATREHFRDGTWKANYLKGVFR